MSSVRTERPQIQVLLVTGRAIVHHRWRAAAARLREILDGAGIFEVRTTEAFQGATARTLEGFDVVILNYSDGSRPGLEEHRWGADTERALLDFVHDGGGLVVEHAFFAVGSPGPNSRELNRMIGGVMHPLSRRAPGDRTEITIVDGEHPITRDVPRRFVMPYDDKMVNFSWHPDAHPHVLATMVDDAEAYLDGAYYAIEGMPGPQLYDMADVEKLEGVGQEHPACWTVGYGKGRVFALIPGHVGATTREDAYQSLELGRDVGPTQDAATHVPEYITLLLRGTEWAAVGDVTQPVVGEGGGDSAD